MERRFSAALYRVRLYSRKAPGAVCNARNTTCQLVAPWQRNVRNGEEVTLLIRSGTIAWLRSTSGHAKTRGNNPDRWYNARHGGFGYKYSTVSRSIDRT